MKRSLAMSNSEVSEFWWGDQGVPSEVVCAIDVGSKTLKLVSGYRSDGRIVTRRMGKSTLKLGEAIRASGGVIRAETLQKLRGVLNTFRNSSERNGASRLMAVGTDALRRAKNRTDVLAAALDLGIELEIADGHREGVLAYLAATHGELNRLVSEFGSHSLQIAWACAAPLEVLARPAGYLFAYNNFVHGARYFSQAEAEFRAYLDQEIPGLPWSPAGYVALSANSAVSFSTGMDKRLIMNTHLQRWKLQRKLQELRGLTVRQFSELKLRTDKVSKVLPGLIFLDYMMERSGSDLVFIAEAELPAGLIVEHFKSRDPACQPFFDSEPRAGLLPPSA